MNQKSPTQMNFLIVDDMDNMRRSVRAMLKLINYGKSIYESPNGQEAWKFLNSKDEEAIDFIICDQNMPLMKGTELLNTMRKEQKLRDIPFLMITAEANTEVVAEAAEHDVDAYLTKPFVTASLEAKIDELLNNLYNPDKTTLLLREATLVERKGNIPQAMKLIHAAATLKPGLSRPHRELGRLFLKLKKVPEAVREFSIAIDINRLDVTSYHYLGQLYFHQGKIDKAIKAYSYAMDISPRHTDRAFKFVGLLVKKKELKKAEKILKIVLRHNNENIKILEQISTIAARHNFNDLAVRCYKTILKYSPRQLAIHKCLGIQLQKQGKFNEASTYLERAVTKFHQDVELLLSLAQCHLDMGRLIMADKWAAKVTQIEPDNVEARHILNQCG
jgi:CheY-like chemotaxis protein/Tfp pilus assembly protein PilF